MTYEYKVVPAPVRGLKAKGIRTPQERFAHALELAMNELAADGWEYLRADTLPCEQREGLMSKTNVYQNMLVFRRTKTAIAAEPDVPAPQLEAPRPKTGEERLAEKQAKVTEEAKDEAIEPPASEPATKAVTSRETVAK